MAELMVAGSILNAALNVLFDRLASPKVLAFFLDKNLDEELLENFKLGLITVNALLDDAEMKEFASSFVKQWLDELKHTIYDAEDLVDEIYTMPEYNAEEQRGRFSTYTMGTRVEKIVKKIDGFVSRKDILGLSGGVRDTSIPRGQTTSLVEDAFFGRDAEKQKIIDSLLLDGPVGDEIPVIPIVGMGGLGKTTLAKSIYNDKKVVQHFKLRAWVCDGTQKFDVFRLTKNFLESVTSSDCNTTNLDVLQRKLVEAVSGRMLLLVLDDVWDNDYIKWGEICSLFVNVSSGSKIIVTTRDDSVPKMMGAASFDSLGQLSDDSSWKLFENHAFGKGRNPDAYPHLEEIGKGIVKKCKGLPLAIKTLAGTLRNNYEVKYWEMIMKSEIWESPSVGKSNNILPVLKLSYHYLPSHLKQCFAYCSIFPQDYKFVKNELIFLWMAEGFLVDKDNNMEELGERYFDELVSRSFFQKSSGDFVMHDLMNDLAQLVSGDFSIAFQRNESHQVSKKVRHFSYSRGQYDVLNKTKPIVEVTNLRTFLSVEPRKSYVYNSSSSAKLLSDILPKLGCVRVLSLYRYNHDFELPDSICSLVHLRYLNLSETALKSLPDTICKLYNLQTLLLRDCRHLIKLPTNLGELVNLRHLDITGTFLNKMPLGIKKLESLQTLSNLFVGENNCSGLGELKELCHLKGSLSIERLQNVENVEDVIEAYLKGKMGIEKMLFKWDGETENSKNVESILDELQPSANLTHLTLDGYGGTRLSNWLWDGSVFNLTYLYISDCVHCLSLPSLGQLPSLEELHIRGLTSLTRVDVDFYKNGLSSIKPFQKLVILEFYGLKEWEDWSTPGVDDNDEFPKLEKLSIDSCPKLRGNLPNLLPALQKLEISRCKELTTIIPGGASLQSLKLECKNVLFENNTSLNSLKSLEMDGLESNSFPNGMMESCNNLEELKIRDWSALMHFPDDGLPTTLREIKIGNCYNLEFFPKETFHNYKYLERLSLQDSCESMTSFSLGLFSSLKILEIKMSKNLESFYIADDHRENLNSLEYLSIDHCDKLIDFPRGGLPASNLKSLEIENCKKLKSLPEGMKLQLTSLERLSIQGCEEVESFPTSSLPSNLKYLQIWDCKKLKSLPEGMKTQLTSLETLRIGGCEEVELFPTSSLPSNLKLLSIGKCKKLNSLPEGMNTQLASLEWLSIFNCEEVESLFPAGDGLPSKLRTLWISNCKKVMAKRREWDLQNHLLFLTYLSINHCEEIEAFPEADCQFPISLTELRLGFLPNIERIDASRLLNLSSLTTLEIWYCPKVKFDPKPRNTQDLPISFHKLWICKSPLFEEQVRTMKRDLIPELWIDGKRVTAAKQ